MRLKNPEESIILGLWGQDEGPTVKFVELLWHRLRSWCTLHTRLWSTVCFHRGRAKRHGNTVQIYQEEGKQKSEEMYIGDNKVNIRKVGLYYTNIIGYQ